MKELLRIIYQGSKSTFQDLLNNSIPIYHRNLKCLATETFKICQKFQEKHLRPKQVCIIFVETILLKDAKCTS